MQRLRRGDRAAHRAGAAPPAQGAGPAAGGLPPGAGGADRRPARRTAVLRRRPTEPAMTRDLLELSAVELDELRRTVQPLARQLAARIGRRRRQQATGRLDARTTARRSLQSGGVPLDPAWRKRHPHRPEVVVLCDVSGSVAEFAQFTFTLVHALHAELARVRSFAFVDGVVEVTDLFADGHARHPRRPAARTAGAHRRRRPHRLRPGLRAVLPAATSTAPSRHARPCSSPVTPARTTGTIGRGPVPQPLPAGPAGVLAQPRAPETSGTPTTRP